MFLVKSHSPVAVFACMFAIGMIACGPTGETLDDPKDAVVDAAVTEDATATGCKVATDCVANGEPGLCQRWLCDAGTCFKSGVPDGTVCTGANACLPGICKLGDCKTAAKTCSKSTEACEANTCDPADGLCKKSAVADGESCDDGDKCTAGEACLAGKCAGGLGTCGCETHADCENDDNLCNGTLYCDSQSGQCAVNPATVVHCTKAKDTACSKNKCATKTGKCAMQPVADATQCDDGNACTSGDTCAAGECKPGVVTCQCKKTADCVDVDGDLCTGTPFCNLATGQCVVNPATKVVCATADNTTCAKNTCQPKTGTCKIQPVAGGKLCDDGNVCTTGEQCAGGKCTPKTNTCKCNADADCASKEDGNVCNGTMFCNQLTKLCQVNPATILQCPSVDDTACAVNTCDPKTGSCSPVAATENAVCDDGDPCTTGDVCQKGVCTPSGVAKACVCQSNDDCAKFEDGNLCNGTLYCNLATKQCATNPKTVVQCPSGNDTTCSHNTCAPKTGKCAMTPAAVGTMCDDKQACTVVDRCGKEGTCEPGMDVCQCGPHKPKVSCDATFGDGNACNGVLVCNTTKMPFVCVQKAGSAVTCQDDGNPCTNNLCDPKSGKCTVKTAANGASCALTDKCVKTAVCSAGTCAAKTKVVCDDANPCTTDTCDPKTGKCAHTNVKDGEACASTDKCAKAALCAAGQCKVATTLSCDDGDVCTKDTCDPKTGGCTTSNAANGTACALADKCVTTAACTDGQCAAVKKVACPDSTKVCVDNVCDPKTGKCGEKTADNGALCTLANKCVDKAACANGACEAQSTKVCDDGNVCTTNGCDSKTGSCVSAHVGDGKVCSLADKCVKSSACKSGACAAKDSVPCNDSKPCTTDACDAKTGKCVFTQMKTGAACNDGSKCTETAKCDAGECKMATQVVCKDGKVCTVDGCDAKTGCTFVPVVGSLPCPVGESGSLCAKTALCKAGACVVETLKTCSDSSPCTAGSCDAKTGKCEYSPASNGTSCTLADKCVTGTICVSGKCAGGKQVTCDDDNPCTSDSCDKTAGCKHTSVPTGFTVACYEGPSGTLGVGNCKSGNTQCDAQGKPGVCSGQTLPKGTDWCGNGNEDCDGEINEDCTITYKIAATCGSGQEAQPGKEAFQRFAVKVTDGNGKVLDKAKVLWSSPNGGSFQSPSTLTNTLGIATNVFSVGKTDGTTYVGRATVEGTTTSVDLSAKANAKAQDYVFNYVNFCDTSLLAKTGVAAYVGNTVRVVTGGDWQNGSFWFTKPLVKDKSFQVKATVNGFTRGYSLVFHSTAAGTKLPAGGYADQNTPKLKPAMVLQITGLKGGGSYKPPTLTVYGDGVVLGAKSSLLPLNQNQTRKTFWLDYDHNGKKLSFYISSSTTNKPTTPSLTVTTDFWKTLGSNGKQIYTGFTAGNSSAGHNGSKYVERWSYVAF